MEQNFKRVLLRYTILAQNYAEDVHFKKIEALILKLPRMENFCIISEEADFHVAVSSNYKILEKFVSFKAFLTYNILAGKQLKFMYSKMVHITCVSHMRARVATVTLEQKSKTKTRSLIKAFIKISRVRLTWRIGNLMEKHDEHFP